MTPSYPHDKIEPHWQAYWQHAQLNAAVDPPTDKPPCYILDMFPYPSGAGLHVGHPLGYVATDILARYKRMQGYNVLHPIGFDAFGLPAEQYAVETGQHPEVTTEQNITQYIQQLRRLGLSYDWDRVVRTTDSSYYQWTQWMFRLWFTSWYDILAKKARPIEELVAHLAENGTAGLLAACDEGTPDLTAEAWGAYTEAEQQQYLLRYRLAYRAEVLVNWCPILGTVLSNDEVKDGYSERGGHPVERRNMWQWLVRMRAYAGRLLDGLEDLEWPEPIKAAQSHWIGKSEGASVDFVCGTHTLTAFTTCPHTIYGVTYLALAPESPWVGRLVEDAALLAQAQVLANRSERARQQEAHHDTGFDTGKRAIHPLTGEALPIWVADYVLAGYGTGVVMGVPAHDDRDMVFAQAHGLLIREVMDLSADTITQSGALDGLTVGDGAAKAAATALLEERGVGCGQVQWRLRDAVFGRQRYWGEPIPIYYDKGDKGDDVDQGVPYVLDEGSLPLRLPTVDNYAPTATGESPLVRAKDWQTAKGLPYETTTMPAWAGSNWYFFRYMDPKNPTAFCADDKARYWKQVDYYVGGSEHAVGHLLYARFCSHVLYDRGYVSHAEFAKRLINQGKIQGKTCYVYRIVGEQTYVSKNLLSRYDTQTLYVSVQLVDAQGILDIAAFKSSHPDRASAKFIVEEGKYHCGIGVEKMSKSKHNVVTPDEIVETYGADTFRLYEMFLGPIEQDKPWDLHGIMGIYRFLTKLWRWYEQPITADAPTDAMQRALHKMIAKVQHDTEAMAFNTAISALMIGVGELITLGCHAEKTMATVLRLLAPYTPHLAEELWQNTFKQSDSVLQQPYPKAQSQWTVERTFDYPISINGKLRTHLTLPRDITPEEAEQQVRQDPVVQKWVGNQTIVRFIFVRDKIINLPLRP